MATLLNSSLRRRNGVVGVATAGLAVAMLGAAFAAVPLYKLFCQVTGYGGTTQVAAAAPGLVPGVEGSRPFTIVFDANVAKQFPWEFRPEQRQVTVRAGEEGLAFYIAHNPIDRPIKGQAAFNVTPLQAGKYFSKVQCFCFDEQVLLPGQTEHMGVAFFVDPAILKDRNMADLKIITLSYTFYEVPGQQAGLAGAATTAGANAAAPVR
ncbi:MAG: cytochrome c oxidase assembly protein [Alphaproteobacteria bacterium]|nr:cytochrome c oxidase assembly protein [Alphaproteobacteria bacterium]